MGVAYACGDARFDAALLSTKGAAERADRPDAAAIREELAHPSLDQAVLPPSGYWLVDEAPGRSRYLSAPLGVAEQYVALDVSEKDGTWAVRSATECRPSAVVDGVVGEATWTWDPAVAAPDPATTTFTALVHEYACASGQPVGERLHGPEIVVLPDRVLVGFAVEPLSGGQDCEGVDPTPVTVTLPEPLGDRALVDTGGHPFADPGPTQVVPPTPLADLPAPKLPDKLDGVTKLLGASGTSESAPLIRSVAVPHDADRYYLRLGCTGTGTIALIIDGVGDDVACDAAGLSEFGRGVDDTLDFSLETEGVLRYTVAVDARDIDAGPGFHVPALTMTGPDYTAGDLVTLRGFEGCGLSYAPKGGPASVTDCGPSWQPVATSLHQRPGTSVSFAVADGWTITRISGLYAEQDRILPSGRDPVRTPWFGEDAGLAPVTPDAGGEVLVPVPPVGGWGLLVYVTATKDGDEFSVPYYFRIDRRALIGRGCRGLTSGLGDDPDRDPEPGSALERAHHGPLTDGRIAREELRPFLVEGVELGGVLERPVGPHDLVDRGADALELHLEVLEALTRVVLDRRPGRAGR